MAQTKDEKFIVALYKEAMNLGDPYHPVNCYLVGTKLGLQKHAIEIICRGLAQCNFIKKGEEDAVYLTPHGENLVQSLM